MTPTINPARLDDFATAYAPAILAAVKSMGPWTGAKTAEDYALDTTMAMLATIERAGVEAASHYYLNREAFPAACATLGIPATIRSIEDYLSGASATTGGKS